MRGSHIVGRSRSSPTPPSHTHLTYFIQRPPQPLSSRPSLCVEGMHACHMRNAEWNGCGAACFSHLGEPWRPARASAQASGRPCPSATSGCSEQQKRNSSKTRRRKMLRSLEPSLPSLAPGRDRSHVDSLASCNKESNALLPSLNGCHPSGHVLRGWHDRPSAQSRSRLRQPPCPPNP